MTFRVEIKKTPMKESSADVFAGKFDGRVQNRCFTAG